MYVHTDMYHGNQSIIYQVLINVRNASVIIVGGFVM